MSKDLGTWIASILVAGIVSYGLMFAFLLPYGLWVIASQGLEAAESTQTDIISQVIGVIPSAVLVTFAASLMAMAVRQTKGEQITFSDLFAGFRRFGSFLVLAVVYAIFAIILGLVVSTLGESTGVIVGLVLVLLGLSIWLYPTYMNLGPRLILTNMSLGEAIGDTYRTTTRFALSYFALNIVLGLMLMGAVLLCFVPFLFALPVYFVVLALHYRYFFQDGAPRMMEQVSISEVPPQ